MVFSWHMRNSIIQRKTPDKDVFWIALCLFCDLIPGGVAPQQSSVTLQVAMQNNKMQMNPPKTGAIFSTRFDL